MDPPFVDLFQDLTPGHETRILGHIVGRSRSKVAVCRVQPGQVPKLYLLYQERTKWRSCESLRHGEYPWVGRYSFGGTFDEVYIYINTNGNGGGQVMISDA